MTNTGIVVASSVVSLGVGAAIAHILTKKQMIAQYEGQIEAEVAKAKAFYSQLNKTGEYADPVELAEKLVPVDEDETDAPMTPAEYVGRKEDHKGFVAYDKIAKAYSEGDSNLHVPKMHTFSPDADMTTIEQAMIDYAKAKVAKLIERSGEEELNEEEGEVDMTVSRNIFRDGDDYPELDRSVRGASFPYIISLDEFEEGDQGFNRNSCTYYQKDNVLADDQDQPIDEVDEVIGRQNLQFGNSSGQKDIVFVRNMNMEVDFEIARSYGSFAEEVLGIYPEQGLD